MSRYYFIEFKKFDEENIERIFNFLYGFHVYKIQLPYFINYELKQLEFIYMYGPPYTIYLYLKPSMFLKYDKKLNKIDVWEKEKYLNYFWRGLK